MATTIDEIIDAAQKDYQLNVNETNRRAISSFLDWFLHKNSFDLPAGKKFNGYTPAFSMMIDVALMYSYLQGERSVREKVYNEKTIFIGNKDQLPFIRSRGNELAQWPDNNLYTLYLRRERSATPHSLPKYQQLFNFVAAYPLLIERWGKQLHYAEDVAVKRGGKYLNRVVR